MYHAQARYGALTLAKCTVFYVLKVLGHDEALPGVSVTLNAADVDGECVFVVPRSIVECS